MDDIGEWLKGLGMGQYAAVFAENAIDAEVLPELTDADLRELGLPLGHRKRLLRAIAGLSAEPESARSATATAATPPATAPEAERRQLTVLFCDLVGSTALSARLDPEEMGAIIRRYQGCVAEVIGRWDGHVAKYMGDGVLVYFGYPTAHEDDPERAVRAGLELVEAVGRLGAGDGATLAVRVGIATGLVMVGDLIGEGAARERAVVGDTPNLAARLQALAEPGGVVIAPSTRQLLGRLFELVDLGRHDLKGFAEPIRTWRVLGEGRAESRFEALHGGKRLMPLIGREHEIGLLLERFERAKEGEGQVVLLAGEPGVGKSRLVRALRERLNGEPYTPLSHYCSPYHVNTAFFPVIGLLERAAGFERHNSREQRLDRLEALLARSAKDVRDAAPLLAALLSIPTGSRYPPLDLTPQRQKQRILEILVEQLEELAAKQPVLALYEDAHWVDPSTLELLGLVVERAQRLRVLVVITFRPEFQPPWTGYPHVTWLSLSRLTRRHGAAMVQGVTGGKPLPPEVVEQILTRTDGVPLFVEELTKAVLESGLLRDMGDRYALTGPLPPVAVPATLQDSLMARLDRLAPVKEVAQIAACIGREFDHELLAAVAGLDERDLHDALDQLVRAELLFRRGTPPEAAYSFKHALIRDAAYESLLRSRRQQLHGRIADAIERQAHEVTEVEPETVAHHLTEAGLAQRAVEYWLKAGQRASSRSAHKEAINHLTQGLRLLTTLPTTDERARRELELQIALGAPLLATKGFAAPEVEAAYARAERLGRELGERSHLATALRGLCYVHHVRAGLRHVEELTAELLGLAGQTSSSVLQADAHNAAGFNLFHLGRFRLARDHLQRAVERLDPSSGLAHATSLGVNVGVFNRAYAGHCDWHLGDPERALEEVHEAIDLARRFANPFSVAVALAYTAMLHQFRREPDRVRERAEAVLAVSGERGFSYYRAWAEIMDGWATAVAGDAMDGILRIQQGLADINATGAQLRLPYYHGLLGELYLRAGQVDAAAGALAEAFAVAERNAETWYDTDLWLLKGAIRLAVAADEQQAADCYGRAMEIGRAQGAMTLVLRAALRFARLRSEQGRRMEAHDLLAPATGWFDREAEFSELNEARILLEALT
ncbi:MAG TPA: AAA family ATPase [Gemmatimonadales bacterium]|nr:AAA family ATPase [Gemmatimonadales bacterium]